MADPKGTYFSPSERGLATVLPSARVAPGGGLTKQMLSLQKAKDARLARSRKEIFDILKKPYTTDLMFQPSLDKKKTEAIEAISQMIAAGNESGARAYAYEMAQDLASYAASGKQVATLIDNLKKNADAGEGIINEDKLLDYVSELLHDENGNIRDPNTIRPNELTLDTIIFENPNGDEFLNQEKVFENVIKSNNFKELIKETTDIGDVYDKGKGFTGYEKRTQKIGVSPFATELPDGTFVLKDPKGLVESGLMTPFLDDKFSSKVVMGMVRKHLKETGGTPIEKMDEATQNMYIADAIRAGLEGQPLSRVISKKREDVIRSRSKVKSVKLTATEKKQKQFSSSRNEWIKAIRGELGKAAQEEAIFFVSGIQIKEGEVISGETKIPLSALGAGPVRPGEEPVTVSDEPTELVFKIRTMRNGRPRDLERRVSLTGTDESLLRFHDAAVKAKRNYFGLMNPQDNLEGEAGAEGVQPNTQKVKDAIEIKW